jgi:arginine decarboxylase
MLPSATDRRVAPHPRRASLSITVRTAAGRGRTPLSAFDDALFSAGVGDLNLIHLSSVIPPGSVVDVGGAPVPGGHGERLYCVYAAAYAEQPGQRVWAGLGWTQDESGGGLFVEHVGTSEQEVIDLVGLTMEDMDRRRGGRYGPVRTATVEARHTGRPACALVLAAYEVEGWGRGVRLHR